jgi:hypothetical protein
LEVQLTQPHEMALHRPGNGRTSRIKPCRVVDQNSSTPDRGVAAVVLVNDQRSSDRVAIRLLSMI